MATVHDGILAGREFAKRSGLSRSPPHPVTTAAVPSTEEL
jgi:hypothetical protein